MGANDASTSGGPERRPRRGGAYYGRGRYTELTPRSSGKGKGKYYAGPEWDLWYVPDEQEPKRSAPSTGKPRKPRPRPKSAPPTKGGASDAVFRPIDAPTDHERPQSAPIGMLSPEEVDETITEVEMSYWTEAEIIARVAAEFEQLLAQ